MPSSNGSTDGVELLLVHRGGGLPAQAQVQDEAGLRGQHRRLHQRESDQEHGHGQAGQDQLWRHQARRNQE